MHNTLNHLRSCITLAAVAFVLFGCKRGFSGYEHVHITVKNVGSKELIACAARLGEYLSVAGALSPGISATHLMFDHPITSTAEVTFQLVDEPLEKRTVEVGSVIPPGNGQSLELIFEIDSDSLTVNLATRAE